VKSFRKTSLVAGVIYVITFVSIPTLTLYTSIHDPNYMVGNGADSKVIIGSVLEIIVALAGVGSAVVLYPVLRKQNQSMALGLVGARIIEAGTIFAGVASLITVVSLRQSGVGDDGTVVARALVTLYDQFFLIGQSLMPVFDDLLLGLLLYHSRLVPRGLALIGILGAPLLLSSDIAVLFGFLEQKQPLAMMSAIPVALFEISFGILLIVKGFNKSHALPTD